MTHRRQIVDRQRCLAGRGRAPAPRASTPRAQGAGAKKVALVDDGAPDVVTYGLRDDVVRFAEGVAERRGLDADWVRDALAQARFIPAVARYIMPPTTGTAKNWAAYRARFVEPIRIRAGVAFWRANAALARRRPRTCTACRPRSSSASSASSRSSAGRWATSASSTRWRRWRSISRAAARTAAPSSATSSRAWFVLCKSEGIDPLAWRGSYAGALGMPQFMPSSFNKYAVDFDGDGHVDLHAQRRRRDRQRRQLPRRVRLEARPAGALRRQAADRHQRARRPARARHRADLHRRRDGRSAAPGCPSRRSPSTACSRSSSCRTATPRRATSPARPTSTRSRATTGRATTRWRCSSSAKPCARWRAEPSGSPRSSRGRASSSDQLSRTSRPRRRSQLESNQPGPATGPNVLAAPRARCGRVSMATSASSGCCCGMRSLRGDARKSRGARRVAHHPPEAGTRGGEAPSEVLPRAGESRCYFGTTLTATFIVWPRPPRMTPRSGTTSAKSAPVASVM